VKIGNGQHAVGNSKKIKLIVWRAKRAQGLDRLAGQTRLIPVGALCALLLIPCSSVPAQQPKKVPQIGFLMGGSRGAILASRHFARGCMTSVMLREKISPLSGDLQRGKKRKSHPFVGRVDPYEGGPHRDRWKPDYQVSRSGKPRRSPSSWRPSQILLEWAP
jgi:hypothetical protein